MASTVPDVPDTSYEIRNIYEADNFHLMASSRQRQFIRFSGTLYLIPESP